MVKLERKYGNRIGGEMKVSYGKSTDIKSWMDLVQLVRDNFPGLETEKSLEEHKNTVLKFMDKKQAICVKDSGKVIGVLLFSKNRNMICYLAVHPKYRRLAVASHLLSEALKQLDHSMEITVSTFRENDEKGVAPRALYKKFGFVEGELIEEFGYPNQIFILYP